MAKLARTLQSLSPEAQAEILDELEARIANLSDSGLSAEQNDIVKKRMAQPREYVSNEDVAKLLQRFKSTA